MENNTKAGPAEANMESQTGQTRGRSRPRAESILAPGFAKDKDGYIVRKFMGEELNGPGSVHGHGFVNKDQNSFLVLLSTLVKVLGFIAASIFNAILAIPFFIVAAVPVLIMSVFRSSSARVHHWVWPRFRKTKPAPPNRGHRIKPTLMKDQDISPLILAADSPDPATINGDEGASSTSVASSTSAATSTSAANSTTVASITTVRRASTSRTFYPHQLINVPRLSMLAVSADDKETPKDASDAGNTTDLKTPPGASPTTLFPNTSLDN